MPSGSPRELTLSDTTRGMSRLSKLTIISTLVLLIAPDDGIPSSSSENQADVGNTMLNIPHPLFRRAVVCKSSPYHELMRVGCCTFTYPNDFHPTRHRTLLSFRHCCHSGLHDIHLEDLHEINWFSNVCTLTSMIPSDLAMD
jgi:hypothetical protein